MTLSTECEETTALLWLYVKDVYVLCCTDVYWCWHANQLVPKFVVLVRAVVNRLCTFSSVSNSVCLWGCIQSVFGAEPCSALCQVVRSVKLSLVSQWSLCLSRSWKTPSWIVKGAAMESDDEGAGLGIWKLSFVVKSLNYFFDENKSSKVI